MSIRFFWDKVGQVGETLTWMVATVAIVVILLISVFASSAYFLGDNKRVSVVSGDFPAKVSFYSWLLTEGGGGDSVYEQLKTGEDLNDFNGNLAVNIFEEFYGEDYFDVWVGLRDGSPLSNNYFGVRPSTIVGGDVNRKIIPHLIENVIVDENKIAELVLAPFGGE